jgi:hypothetical protein
MKTTLYIKLLAIAGLLMAGTLSCKKDEVNEVRQKVFFEYHYFYLPEEVSAYNIISTYHWIIDYKGNVRINKNKDSLIWIDPVNLNDYYDSFDSVVYTLDKKDMDYYTGLIEAASKGRVDSTAMNTKYFGEYDYSCYWYNGENKKFVPVLLSSLSDVSEKKNADTSAVTINNWLKTILDQLGNINHDQQKIFFYHFSASYWGSQLSWIIDYEGNVRTCKSNVDKSIINPKKIDHYYSLFDSILYKVDKNELTHYISLIDAASNGNIEVQNDHCYDCGTASFGCFQYIKVKNETYPVLLSSFGPTSKINTDISAIAITTWLQDVHTQMQKKE